ncbi:MAG TPA: M15 family metallopeptidase [Luteimonas sp.]|nr:M15 family metallopeptidase [Luteimonas sp.]
MQPPRHPLVNTEHIELWPARALRARGSADARVLARARTVLRRKRDGAYLAAHSDAGLVPMVHGLQGEPGLADATTALARLRAPLAAWRPARLLPVHHLHARLRALGLDADAYAVRSGLLVVAEPAWLADAGRDRYRRPLWLDAGAARAWARMRAHARLDGVVLEAVSGYRSHAYQLGIFARKLARGLGLDDILTVNAAPGFSEHHSGRALDIAEPGGPAAEAAFEDSAAFAWLQRNAGRHGFAMSYPRDNPHGIVHEPWHWCYHPR